MDLIRNLGVTILNSQTDVIIEKKENLKKVKEGLLKHNEYVYLLEINSPEIEDVNQEKYFRFYYFLQFPLPNFLRLKYVIEKEIRVFFYAYEKVGIPLSEYLEISEISIKKRLFIYKQAIEVVFSLVFIYKDENFEFNQNFIFIQEKENLINDKIPILKIIYDGN